MVATRSRTVEGRKLVNKLTRELVNARRAANAASREAKKAAAAARKAKAAANKAKAAKARAVR